MPVYILRRLLITIPMLFGITFVVTLVQFFILDRRVHYGN